MPGWNSGLWGEWGGQLLINKAFFKSETEESK